MTTSDKIRELIEERDLTQQQFAKLVGIHYVTLNKNLTIDNFSSKSLEKIAKACGISVYDLQPDSVEITLTQVSGYIEHNGEIVKIKDLKALKKLVDKLDTQESLMKAKQVKLPKQKNITLEDITLDHWEEYDATQMQVMSFRHHYDVVNGVQFNVGNMCAGFPFTLHGIIFQNSEAAYIAGIYSHDNPEHIRLQKALIAINDGYKAKKEYRHTRYDHVKREDWESFNIEWMKYVVWQKCKTNSDFAELLISIPKTAMVVENSTGMTGATAQVWGCFNSELEELRDAKVKRYAIEHSIRKENDERLNIERNRWNNYGVWSGKNLMGKIIKMCSICLQQGIELPIDYELLQSKHIHLLGQELQFISPIYTSTIKALILDFDMTLFNTRPSTKARLAKDWEKAYEQIPQFTLYDGWREVFDYTKAHGIKTILISRATKNLMERTLNHFGLNCDVIIGSRRGYPSKKDANSYVLVDKALDQLQCNISRSNIISVGDSATDRTMSENAGVRFVGAIWDCEKEESYTELQKGETIKNPKEIIHILESNQEISATSESSNIVCTDARPLMYGVIAGDMIGKPYERRKDSIHTTDFLLFEKRSKYTDDTILTIAIMDWLMSDNNFTWEVLETKIVNYTLTSKRFNGQSRCFSNEFAEWIKNENREKGRVSDSNGAVMRVSPVGWFFNDIESVEKVAEIQATLTHNHPDAVCGAKAVATTVLLARKGKTKEEIRDFISSRYDMNLNYTMDGYRTVARWTTNGKETAQQAIMSFLCTDNFEDAIRYAVSLGTDSDTVGAITGGIAEAFYRGVPEHIKNEIHRRAFPDEYWDVIRRFGDRVGF